MAISNLIRPLTNSMAIDGKIIPWSSPVPSFGDALTARVATLGLNPSNKEFVDPTGRELVGIQRRFHTLRSLGISEWVDAEPMHVDLIWERCRTYFECNPYDIWFKQLDDLLRDTGLSYYENGGACHLDLIPYATACKWTDLTRQQRSLLFEIAGANLATLLSNSSIELLILNGRSVVSYFQEFAQVELNKETMPDWTLSRKSVPSVSGIAYSGLFTEFSRIPTGRPIKVIGFNHNIQSSFGVTTAVRESIRSWIGREKDKTN